MPRQSEESDGEKWGAGHGRLTVAHLFMVDVVDGGWWMVDGPSMIHPSQRLVPDSQWLEKAAPVERSSIVSTVPYRTLAA